MCKKRGIKPLLISSMLILLLSGCSTTEGESRGQTTTVTPIQSVKDNKAEVKPNTELTSTNKEEEVSDPTDKNLYMAEDGKLHLNGYEWFDQENKDKVHGDFKISEEWINNTPYYKMESQEVKLLVDAWGENWTLYNGESKKQLDYHYPLYDNGNSFTIPGLYDCLGLGESQLILESYGGGTGCSTGKLLIYNIDTCQQYQIEDYSKKLLNFVKLKVLSVKNDIVTIKTICANGKVFQGNYQAVYKEKDKYEANINYFNSYIVSNKGKIIACHRLNSDQNNILGTLSGELEYNGSKVVLKEKTIKFTEEGSNKQ